MATTLFHWTLHPWAIYTVAGLAIGYGVFRKGRGLTISAVFEPLIGKRQVHGPVGKVIDIFAIFATLFGSATSLGLGVVRAAQGRVEEAERLMREAIEGFQYYDLRALEHWALRYLVELLRTQGRMDEAEAYASRRAELAPANTAPMV